MRFGSDLSTGALMRLMVLIALELVLFQGVWPIVWVPPITMMIVTLNLGLYLVVIRPRHLNTAAVGMMIAGLVAVLLVAAYSAVQFWVRWPPGTAGAGVWFPRPGFPRRGWFSQSISVGFIGRLLLDALAPFLSEPPNTQSAVELVVLAVSRWVPFMESVLLDLAGLVVILVGGRLGRRWREREQRGGPARPVPLDGGAATPL
jgi:hypothetical protein